MTRRLDRFLLATAVAACLAAGPGSAMAKTFVYVSNAEDGDIDRYAMDGNGALEPLGKTKAGTLVMPMVASPDRRHLYVIVRSNPLRVVTYAIDAATGQLAEKASAKLPESMPYVSTDATGRFLFTSSYGGHMVAVSPIDPDGLVTKEAIQVIPTGKNAHSIIVDHSNRFVFASNLGSSQILQFTFDKSTGRLTPNDPPLVKVPENNGPRHLVISPDNKFLYASNELSGQVSQFALDQAKGTLTPVTSVPSVPPDTKLLPGMEREAMSATATTASNTTAAGADDRPRIWAADLMMTPDGRFLYATERTDSTISLLKVDPATGHPSYVTSWKTEDQPRGIRIDPAGKFLVATGEKSDRISVYSINARDGTLTRLARYPAGKDANWVVIVDEP